MCVCVCAHVRACVYIHTSSQLYYKNPDIWNHAYCHSTASFSMAHGYGLGYVLYLLVCSTLSEMLGFFF